MKPIRQLLGLDSALKRINKMTKNKKKSLELQDFIPWGLILALRLLCVSFILVKIIFYSHSFHVNESNKLTFGSWFGPKKH